MSIFENWLSLLVFLYTCLYITVRKALLLHVTEKEMITWQNLVLKESTFDYRIALICLVMRFLNQAETDH